MTTIFCSTAEGRHGDGVRWSDAEGEKEKEMGDGTAVRWWRGTSFPSLRLPPHDAGSKEHEEEEEGREAPFLSAWCIAVSSASHCLDASRTAAINGFFWCTAIGTGTYHHSSSFFSASFLWCVASPFSLVSVRCRFHSGVEVGWIPASAAHHRTPSDDLFSSLFLPRLSSRGSDDAETPAGEEEEEEDEGANRFSRRYVAVPFSPLSMTNFRFTIIISGTSCRSHGKSIL